MINDSGTKKSKKQVSCTSEVKVLGLTVKMVKLISLA